MQKYFDVDVDIFNFKTSCLNSILSNAPAKRHGLQKFPESGKFLVS